MDRDVAQLISSKLTDIKNSLTLIVGNTEPSVSSASTLSMNPMRTASDDTEVSEPEPESEPESESEPEPETRKKK